MPIGKDSIRKRVIGSDCAACGECTDKAPLAEKTTVSERAPPPGMLPPGRRPSAVRPADRAKRRRHRPPRPARLHRRSRLRRRLRSPRPRLPSRNPC